MPDERPTTGTEERWTIYVCPQHGDPCCSHVTELYEESVIHTPLVPCNRVCEEVEVVSATERDSLAERVRELEGAVEGLVGWFHEHDGRAWDFGELNVVRWGREVLPVTSPLSVHYSPTDDTQEESGG